MRVPYSVSLEARVGKDKNSNLSDLLEDDKPTPEEELTRNLLQRDLGKLLQELSKKEANVMELRFGLHDNIPRTLNQIGEMMHLSRERVRQIEAQALSKLRQPENLYKIHDYIQNLST